MKSFPLRSGGCHQEKAIVVAGQAAGSFEKDNVGVLKQWKTLFYGLTRGSDRNGCLQGGSGTSCLSKAGLSKRGYDCRVSMPFRQIEGCFFANTTIHESGDDLRRDFF